MKPGWGERSSTYPQVTLTTPADHIAWTFEDLAINMEAHSVDSRVHDDYKLPCLKLYGKRT
jgi:hypothetical protein